MLDSGKVASLADLAKVLGVLRAKVTQMLNLLSMNEEIKELILALDETDEKLEALAERRLRCLLLVKDLRCQKKEFLKLIRD